MYSIIANVHTYVAMYLMFWFLSFTGFAACTSSQPVCKVRFCFSDICS